MVSGRIIRTYPAVSGTPSEKNIALLVRGSNGKIYPIPLNKIMYIKIELQVEKEFAEKYDISKWL